MHYFHFKMHYFHFKMHYFHFKICYFAAKKHYLHFKKGLFQMLPKVKYVKVATPSAHFFIPSGRADALKKELEL